MKKNIWVIDDDQGILDSIQLLFSHHNLRGEFILQPLEVLLRLEKEPHPELIFLDIIMSGINGVQLSQQIKNNPATQSIPIVLMTADPDVANKVKVAHANNYLQKPFDGNEMLALIKEYSADKS